MPKIVHVALQDANATDTDFGGTVLGTASNVLISAATNAVNAQLTSANHQLIAGDWVWITNMGGGTWATLNNLHWQVVSVVDANNFTINVDSTGFGVHNGAGWLYKYAATKTNPCYIRLPNHKYSVGQEVYVESMGGMTQIVGQYFTVQSVQSANTFAINVDATAFTTYAGTNSGYVKAFHKLIQNITQANPAVVQCNDHGFVNGARLVLQNVGGMVELNNKVVTVANATTHTFELSGIDSTGFTAFTSGGEVHWMRATMQKGNNDCFDGDTVKIEKTTAATIVNGGITFTWNNNIASVDVSAPTSGIAVNDLIGFSTSSGNGNKYSYSLVTGVSGSSISLTNKMYLGDTTPTLVEAGCKKVVPVSTGNSGSYLLNVTKNIPVIGGWTFTNNTAPVRDSETWVRHSFGKTINSNNGFYITAIGGSINYLNLAECYDGLTMAGSGSDLHHVTLSGSYYRSIVSTPVTATIHDIMIMGGNYASAPAANISTPALGDECWFVGGASNTGYVLQHVGAALTLSGGNVRCSANGSVVSSINCILSNKDIRFCTTGITVTSGGPGSRIQDCTLDSCQRAITIGGSAYDIEVFNNDISNCSLDGVFISQSANILVRENNFTLCNYDVRQDLYSGNIVLMRNSHNAPTINAVSKGYTYTPTITIIGDTIDEGSRYKALAVIASSANYLYPQYKLLDAFGSNGHFYANFQMARISGASPYIEFQFNSPITASKFPYKLVGTYVKEGVGKAITFRLSTPSAIVAPSITPIITLNGKEIQTEAAITSVSVGTWDEYTINVDGLDIDEEGILNMEFYISSGAGILRVQVANIEDA